MDTTKSPVHPDWCAGKAIALEAELLAFAEEMWERERIIGAKLHASRASMAERAANLLQTYRYRLAKEGDLPS